jgi:hypothetical protein
MRISVSGVLVMLIVRQMLRNRRGGTAEIARQDPVGGSIVE